MKPGGAAKVRKRALALENLYALVLDYKGELPLKTLFRGEEFQLHELRSLIDQLHSIANGGRE